MADTVNWSWMTGRLPEADQRNTGGRKGQRGYLVGPGNPAIAYDGRKFGAGAVKFAGTCTHTRARERAHARTQSLG